MKELGETNKVSDKVHLDEELSRSLLYKAIYIQLEEFSKDWNCSLLERDQKIKGLRLDLQTPTFPDVFIDVNAEGSATLLVLWCANRNFLTYVPTNTSAIVITCLLCLYFSLYEQVDLNKQDSKKLYFDLAVRRFEKLFMNSFGDHIYQQAKKLFLNLQN